MTCGSRSWTSSPKAAISPKAPTAASGADPLVVIRERQDPREIAFPA